MGLQYDNLHDLLYDLIKQVSEIHTIVYKNGLVKSVKQQQTEISEVKDAIHQVQRYTDASPAEALARCPYKQEVENNWERAILNRERTIDKRLKLYAIAIALIVGLPEIIKLIRGLL